jgi:NitT/TauT family transport system substrate-binding protein
VISHDVGRDPLPVKFFYNHLRRNVWELVVPADSRIKTISDLKGATIGVNSLATTNIPTTMSILASAGLDPKKDVTFVAVGMGPPAFQAIRSKQIDVLNLFDTMHAMLERSGFKIVRLEIPAKFVHLSENSLLTHVDNLQNKRTALVGFGRALAKGTIGCYANLPACVRLAWQQDPKLKPQGKSDQDAMDDALAVLKIRGLSYFDFPNNDPTGKWGSFSEEMWKNKIAELHENGIIKSDKIDISTLYTNDLIPDINKFDAAAVTHQAETLK